MPDFRLNEEYEALRQTVRELAREVVAPVIGDFYERHAFPYEIVREMGRMGLFGLPFPEEYGGMGGDYLALGIALEELARVDSSVAITLEAGVSLGAMPIHLFGTAEQKAEWLPRLCSGEILGAFGLTEPDGGPPRPRDKRVGDQRHEVLHHQLGDRHHGVGDGHGGDGPQGGRPPGDLLDHRAVRDTRFHGRRSVLEGRLERLGHPGAVLRGRPRTGGEP